MSKSLIITEKPSVAKDIVQALGGFEVKDSGEYFESKDYVCTYAVGHILGLKEPEDISAEYRRWKLSNLPIVPDKFELKPIEKQEKRLKVIKKLLERKDVDVLINACDAAREGELIFREIVNFFKCSKAIKRVWLQSMTKASIKSAFSGLIEGEKFNNLASAAECRSYSDWLIGMNSTRALTLRLKTRAEKGSSWSAGRVQTPTLAILVEKELEILGYIPRPYWKIQADFVADGNKYQGTWFDPGFKKSSDRDLKEDRIFDKNEAEKIVKLIDKKPAVAGEVRKARNRQAPQLFDLTSLQREANRKFSWSASRTLKAAQRCYETHKMLTYPRTSSKALPSDYEHEVSRILEVLEQTKTYGAHCSYLLKNGLLNKKKIFDDSAVSDHFAIIPTGELKKIEGDDFKLYDLVVRRFLASFYPVAVYEDVERTTVVEGEYFISRPPSILKEPGWMSVYEKEEKENSFLPLKKGQDKVEGVEVKHEGSKIEDCMSRAPSRMNEAGLLSVMENAGRVVEDEELSSALQKAEGLGTAATRADIIENLKYKEYVDSDLRPTPKGIRLIDVLHKIDSASLTSPELTAKLELHLSEVEEGKRTESSFMNEIKTITNKVVESVKNMDFHLMYKDLDSVGKCPVCGSKVYERAWFYSCEHNDPGMSSKEKKCSFIIWKDSYGRYMDRKTVSYLLDHGTSVELDGFRYQTGKMYKAILKLDKGVLVKENLSSEEVDSSENTEPVDATPFGICPIHKGDCKISEGERDYACSQYREHKSGFCIPKVICQRRLSREEVEDLVTSGETKMLHKFISKRKRPFSAKLKLEKEGFSFVFPERKSGKDQDEEKETTSSEKE